MNMSQDVTYVFRDGKTYAIRQGKVIAVSADAAEVERLVKEAEALPLPMMGEEHAPGGPGLGLAPSPSGPSTESCPDCGTPVDPSEGYCPQCGGMLGIRRDLAAGGRGGGGDTALADRLGTPPLQAKVLTPNGLTGTVLGKVAGLWGDEVTVRLENGRIVKLPVGTELRTEKTASAPVRNPIERLEQRLASTPDGTHESLTARYGELAAVRQSAADLIREGVSYADSIRLDQLVVTAEVEQREIQDAINHLDAVEAIAPPKSFTMAAAHEAAGISREDASWLDHTLDEMVKEAEATDFTKLMDEGPEAFAAELPDVALADTGVTRQMASSFITEKTAGIAREVADPYMNTFLARVEDCRRAELSTRKQATHKEAAATEDKYNDLPDESLFL